MHPVDAPFEQPTAAWQDTVDIIESPQVGTANGDVSESLTPLRGGFRAGGHVGRSVYENVGYTRPKVKTTAFALPPQCRCRQRRGWASSARMDVVPQA